MKTLLSRMAAVAMWCGAAATGAGAAPAAKPAYTIPGSEVRELTAKTGRHYQLIVGLPGDYAKNPDKRYPVVYVTDGYWDFQKITAIQGSLVYDREAPPYISVGIGYAGDNPDYGDLRRWELAPVPFGEGGPDKSGHAADFLRTIETEIVPLVEREYRADPAHRVLGGASLGGLFTLFALHTKPELFEGYIAVTPAVYLNNQWLLGYEETFAKAGRGAALRGKRLMVTGGGDESPSYLASILRFNQRVQSRAYEGLAYKFQLIEGERHAGMQLDAYVRGVLWTLAPLAPEHGPSADF